LRTARKKDEIKFQFGRERERGIGSLGGVGVLILGREVVCEKNHISCEIMTLRFNGLQI
jgi:hypothetical protein